MRKLVPVLLLVAMACCTKTSQPMPQPAAPVQGNATPDQGWSPAERASFYTTPQGSRIVPAAWFFALRQADDSAAFSAGQLARYGYLPTDVGDSAAPAKLPIGFVVDDGQLGMTCAACHTGSLSWQGQKFRIDGGRTNADFQQFLTDLAAAARATAASPDRLRRFDGDVLGQGAAPAAVTALNSAFVAWSTGFNDFTRASLPSPAWGAGRLDAFGMIFNRVTGLDLGVAKNERPADAPVRYPFLWGAPMQDRTQWDGAAPNGTYVNALARNTGEVFGVFGVFHPVAVGHLVDYQNGVEFANLQTLEQRIRALQAPAWPSVFPAHQDAAGLSEQDQIKDGARVFGAQCASCHALRASTSVPGTWATPVCRVGTDPKMYRNALLSANSGKLAGSLQLAGGGVLKNPDQKVNILANAVVGSLLRNAVDLTGGVWQALRQDRDDRVAGLLHPAPAIPPAPPLPAECNQAAGTPAVLPVDTELDVATARSVVTQNTAKLYRMPTNDSAYEARVLTGIWAVAPYLHNGSVPSLTQLLTPPAERETHFKVGTSAFDPDNVGVSQTAPDGQWFTVDPNNGNSNAGHDYGTHLSTPERDHLIEYLKRV